MTVLIFSADDALRLSPRRQRAVRPRTDGSFDVGPLPKGNYFATVLTSTHGGELLADQTLLKDLASVSVPFKVERGERKVLQLSVR